MISLASLFNFNVDSDSIQVGSYIIERRDVYNSLSTIIKILIILIIMYSAIKIGNKLIERYVSKQQNFRFSLDEKKAKTIGAILKSVLRYSVYFIGVLSVIETGFGRIGLTFAGIGGVAIGFGSQSLVKDIINGFFILFEDQFAVGDYIHIDDKGGIVESLELRVTKIRDFNGDLHIIPNGLITKVTNHSRGNIRIQVDIDISYDEDVDKAIEIISKLCDRFKNENENVEEGPSVLGVQGFKEGGVTIRIAGKAKPMTQWDTEMKLRKEIRETLKSENINIHYPKVKFVKE
ncbi:mechanosensitive ion channel family protein [Clostridium sp. CX1]|uniref:Mechanosensitive ion channel family protein n=1 Tax=Clostridium tanneri TaxID=3037988 RepID=A0ABU4JXB7_9CLOT|nr:MULTISPECIES: mechanosensitive ion channel family protein [unclassified Clostridium]MCT8977599.1 mechanosensitive ion channel family protein [Clostridium sp. CX1]MDW8802789.1 mechanosensitive ion channel family protein [Clostridium sp. A1-XYC3]